MFACCLCCRKPRRKTGELCLLTGTKKKQWKFLVDIFGVFIISSIPTEVF